MHSIPLAMTWELFARGRWWLLGAFLVANMLPAFLLSALHREGGLDPTDPSMLVTHVVLMQVNMLVFLAALFSAQGHPKRLYAYPVPTTTIVTWHLLPAMVLMALEVAASTALLNAVFHLGWPVWGPAILMAVAFAAVSATLWLTEKSFWLPFAFGGVAVALGMWYKSQYGSMFSQPDHLWLEVTPADAATMAGIAMLSFIVAVVGVARNRRGEPLGSLGILEWLERAYLPQPKLDRPFRSPLAAQSWFELRQKAWAMPATVVFGLLVGINLWVLFSRELEALWKGIIAGGLMLAIVGMIGGLIAGNIGTSDSNIAMGHFLATRPITTRDVANTILKTLAGSVVVSWGIWFSAAIILYVTLLLAGQRPELPPAIEWGDLFATLILPWIAAGVAASIVLCGRIRPFAEIFIGGFALFIGAIVCGQIFVQSPEVAQFVIYSATTAMGLACTVGTIWAFIAAYRRCLVTPLEVCLSIGGWIALICFRLSFGLPNTHSAYGTIAAILLVIGVLALAFFPLAAAPLALAWNRNR